MCESVVYCIRWPQGFTIIHSWLCFIGAASGALMVIVLVRVSVKSAAVCLFVCMFVAAHWNNPSSDFHDT